MVYTDCPVLGERARGVTKEVNPKAPTVGVLSLQGRGWPRECPSLA